jgi:hypothetical protein
MLADMKSDFDSWGALIREQLGDMAEFDFR